MPKADDPAHRQSVALPPIGSLDSAPPAAGTTTTTTTATGPQRDQQHLKYSAWPENQSQQQPPSPVSTANNSKMNSPLNNHGSHHHHSYNRYHPYQHSSHHPSGPAAPSRHAPLQHSTSSASDTSTAPRSSTISPATESHSPAFNADDRDQPQARQSLPSIQEALAQTQPIPPPSSSSSYVPPQPARLDHKSSVPEFGRPQQYSPDTSTTSKRHAGSQSSETSNPTAMVAPHPRSPFTGHLTPISPVLGAAYHHPSANSNHQASPPQPSQTRYSSSSWSQAPPLAQANGYDHHSHPHHHAPPPPATLSHHSSSAGTDSSHTDAAPYSRSWRSNEADQYSHPPPAGASAVDGYGKGPHGDSVKRQLEVFDLDSALNEITDGSRQLLNFSTHYSQKAHNTHRTGPLPGSTPHLTEIDAMMNQSARTQECLSRIRNVVLTQQAALAERSKEQAHKSAAPAGGISNSSLHHHHRHSPHHQSHGLGGPGNMAVDHHHHQLQQHHAPSNGYSDDSSPGAMHASATKLGGFAGADPKKRRGRAAPPGRCHSCNRAETPEWRRGPDGARTLCNACGLHYAKLTRKMGAHKAASVTAATAAAAAVPPGPSPANGAINGTTAGNLRPKLESGSSGGE